MGRKSERFRCDKRVCPNYKEYNARLVQLLARVQNVELDFEHDKNRLDFESVC